jgi:hypothetical protein
MIADQNRLTRLEPGLDAAGRVRQHDDTAAGENGGSHAMHDGRWRVAFIQVDTAEEDQDAQPADPN